MTSPIRNLEFSREPKSLPPALNSQLSSFGYKASGSISSCKSTTTLHSYRDLYILLTRMRASITYLPDLQCHWSGARVKRAPPSSYPTPELSARLEARCALHPYRDLYVILTRMRAPPRRP
ncbi:hypothetical protein B0H12DRAFT_171372 [Mycena haematopus]|nr:hypothetical protein B0H12DRAFT_171372 [Mycena haematopus]